MTGPGPTGSGPVPSSANRLASIDCLRGAAALAVFLFHVSVLAEFDKRVLPPIHLWGRTLTGVLSPLSLGASGVHLFFIISGFCLCLQLWRGGRSGQVLAGAELRRYARNRVARIGPAYWLTVLLSAASVWALADVTLAWLGRDTLLHLLFLHGADPRHFLSLHGGLWSMATEVQFYVLFPLLVLLYARLGGPRFVLGVFALDLGFRLLLAYHPYFHTAAGAAWAPVLANQFLGRCLEFALGMALASLYLSTRPAAEGPRGAAWARRCRLALLPALPVALYCRAFGPPYLPDIALGGLYCLLCGAVVLRPPQQAAPSPVVEWAARFGRASYSFFLIHYLVLLVLKWAYPMPPDAPWGRFCFLLLAALPLSSLCAVALYLGVELPLWRRLRA